MGNQQADKSEPVEESTCGCGGLCPSESAAVTESSAEKAAGGEGCCCASCEPEAEKKQTPAVTGQDSALSDGMGRMPDGDRPTSMPEELGEADADGLQPNPVVTDPDTGEKITLDYKLLLQEPYLDQYYNETFFYLIPKDPESILAIWEVGQTTRDELAKKFGDDFFNHNHLIMRVYQVTGVDFDGFNANEVFEVSDWLDDKLQYWLSVGSGNDYVAEIGYRADGTSFFEKVARSNTVFAPKGYTETQEKYAEWSTIDVDPNNVELTAEAGDWRINQFNYWKKRTHAAPEEKGYWSLVLHQHLPFVHHPEYNVPLEEQWFCEAVVSVYTQLLNMFWKLERDKVDFRLALSLTPSLLSMMQDDEIKMRVARHIDNLIELATRERDNSRGQAYYDTVEQTLHRFWVAKEVFEAYDGDLTRGYRDFQNMGKIEIITCPATHMVLPLFKHFPEAVRAELQTACRQYERVFGRWPRGIWLPENAYTPGVDKFLAEEGIKWFLVNSNGIDEGDTKSFFGTDGPVITPNGVACFGIDQETRAQVWSREGGYPGHPNYKEWYRDLGYEADWDYLPDYFKTANVRRNTGLKYYRITAKGADLAHKDYYKPLWAQGTIDEQASQFVYYRGAKANHAFGANGGRKSVVVSAYDAELFGHWWEEGPEWIEQVFRKMCCDQTEVRPVTPSEYLGEHNTHQKMTPGASSWGKKDYFHTWVLDREYQPNCWVYRHIYRLCGQMIDLATEHKKETDPVIKRALNQAARSLLLAIASDWGFLIETGQAIRYSELQITRHIDRTKELLRQIREKDINMVYLNTLERADNIFKDRDMDYRVFCRA